MYCNNCQFYGFNQIIDSESEEILNLAINRCNLMLKVLNKTSTIKEAYQLNGVIERTYFNWIEEFGIIKHNGKWIATNLKTKMYDNAN
jgi:hypothetical protein